ncbi:MAG: cysteine synthase family protein [Planctomycetes bacterium]|nr:cysteine synthase family protein [Planctomycetota bacterium]
MAPSASLSSPTPVDRLDSLVGASPLLEIRYRLDGRPRCLHAKYESMNMTGSVKDRMAAHILRRAYQRGELRAGDTIVECSSGNTGIAFAALGRALGHPVRIYMPDWMSKERTELIRSFGAEVVPVSREQGGFVGGVRMAAEEGERHDHVFLPRQFDNPDNIEAHELTTGPEIVRQLEQFGKRPDAFVAGVGTGGTVMGVGRHLRSVLPDCRVHPLEPSNSPTLRVGHRVGHHRIQGISDEFVPAILDLAHLDALIDVDDGDAICMAQCLARRLGLAVGISSGANFLGAVKVAAEHDDDDPCVVTVFCDSNKKYLSTDLCRCEPVRDDHWTPRVELESFRAVR